MIFRIVIVCISIIVCSDSVEKLEVEPSYEDSLNQEIQNLLVDINKVPDFSLYSSDGDLYNMRSLEGKVVLLNFWATWCSPCRAEIPDLNEIKQKYNEDDFIILGISITDTKNALIDFDELYAVDYPLLFGSPEELQEITISYGNIYSVPTSILVDKRGEMIFSYPGAILKMYDKYDGVYSFLNSKIQEAISQE